jgi:hypothetical protein
MAILAQGTFSIKRMVNGKTLNFVLVPNKATTQIYTPDPSTYAPDYSVGPYLTITPSLFISGQATDQIACLKAAPTWTVNGSSTLTNYNASAASASPYALTIKKNLSADSQYQVTCTAIYVEPVTLVETPVVATITFTKVSNTGTSIRSVAYAPQGQIFKNNQATILKAHCDMYRGSAIDSTNVSYVWSILSGGTWTNIDSKNTLGITGYGTNEISIPASAVLNTAIFKCTCLDTDASSSTYNVSVSDTLSFVDMSDPYDLDVFTPGGDTVVSGGTTTAQFMIRQANTYMTSAAFTSTKTIKIYRYTSGMVLDTTWGTAGYKTAVLDNTSGKYSIDISESADLLAGQVTNFGFQMEG